MKISRIKAVTMIAVILMLTSTLTIFASISPAKAATISTHGFISAVPNPVGVGQTTNIYFWLAETIQSPSASVSNNNRFRNYTLTIIEPDGTMMPPLDDLARALNVTVAQPYIFDTTSSSSYSFTPAVTGEYTMIFKYTGQGDYYAPGVTGNNFYLPSNTAVATLYVQDEPIPLPSGSYPLPEEYWTRPINDENVDWYKISSNWLNSARDRNQGGIENNRFQPDGIAPNTAHVMWATPLTGESSGFYANYQNPLFQTQFIMQGRLYYPLPTNGWRIVDLRSGENIYEVDSNTNSPTFAYYRDSDHYNQHGVMWGGVLYAINQTSPTTQTWFAYKPGNPSGAGGTYNLTGAIPFDKTWNITNIPMGYEMVDTKGATLRAFVANANLTNPDWRVRLWNDSLGLSGDGTPSLTSPINGANLFTVDKPVLSSNLTPIILQNDTVPVSAKVYYTEFYPNRVTGGVLLCRNGTLPTQTTNTTSTYTYFAVSLFNQTISGTQYREGQLIWMKSYETAADAGITLLQGPSYYSGGTFTPDDLSGAVWTMVEKETGKWIGYSIFNGDKIWESEPQTNFNPYGYTQPTVATGATVSVAYGKLFTAGDSGMVFCYDIQTGDLLWRYEAPIAYSATITNYPTNIGAIADNKIYLGTYALNTSTSLLTGNLIRCLNVSDGTEIWTMPGFGGPGGFAISDGYMAYLNYYDLNVYSVGRGPSAITAGTATPRVSHMGEKVIITGTVTDNSPNPQIKGTPAISDADMGAWMGYMYMNMPKPEATGVSVTLSVFDPNGNTYDIGTAISNSDGVYSFEWDPEVSGEYQVVAKFAGSNSYYPSLAHSTINVEDAIPTPTPEVTPPPSMTETYLLASTLAIIIALIIAGAVIVLTLKRRKA